MANPISGYLNNTSGPDDYREITTTDISPDKVALDVAVKEGNFTVGGLKLRIIYSKTAITDVNFLVNAFLHKKS